MFIYSNMQILIIIITADHPKAKAPIMSSFFIKDKTSLNKNNKKETVNAHKKVPIILSESLSWNNASNPTVISIDRSIDNIIDNIFIKLLYLLLINDDLLNNITILFLLYLYFIIIPKVNAT